MSASGHTCTLIACLLVTSAAPAQSSLLWKFEKGQTFEVERAATQKQTVELNGKQFKQQRLSTWIIRLEVKDKHADGFVMLATLQKVVHLVTGGTDADAIDPKLHEKMYGSAFRLIVTPAGRIVDLQGYEDFLARLAAKDKTRLKSLRITFPESAVKETLAELFGPLPPMSVMQGDVWKRKYLEPIPHFGALRSIVNYRYEEAAKNLDRIAYTIETAYELPKDDVGVLFRIVKGRIDSEKANGRLVFDRAAGHLVEHERTMLLRGTLTIESMDRQQPLEFTSANEVKIRVTKSK